MPTYQYTCTECGEPVEAVQKFSDAPLTVCTACGGRLRKVFSPVGIVFKGSGFYRTDSRNGKTAADAPTKDKDKPSGDSPAKAASSESASNGNGSPDKKHDKKSGDSVSSPAKSSSSSSSEKVA